MLILYSRWQLHRGELWYYVNNVPSIRREGRAATLGRFLDVRSTNVTHAITCCSFSAAFASGRAGRSRPTQVKSRVLHAICTPSRKSSNEHNVIMTLFASKVSFSEASKRRHLTCRGGPVVTMCNTGSSPASSVIDNSASSAWIRFGSQHTE